MDAGNMGVQGYQITSSNGGLNCFQHPPIPQGHPSLHHLPPNFQGMRGQAITFPPQMTASSRRHLPNNSSNITTNLLQGAVEAGPIYMPSLPTGFGLYRPHQRAIVLERNTRHRNLPNMRVLPEDVNFLSVWPCPITSFVILLSNLMHLKLWDWMLVGLSFLGCYM